MSVLRDYVQLDTRWVNIGGVDTPEYPSIILSHCKDQNSNSGDIDVKDISFFGTDIISFVKTYDAGFIAECRAAIDKALNAPGEYPVTFSYYGYIENVRIDFTFNFGHFNPKLHRSYLSLDIDIVKPGGTVATYIGGLILVNKESPDEAAYLEFLSTNDYKVYISINSPDRNIYNKSYAIAGYKSGVYAYKKYIRIAENSEANEIFNTYFWNKPQEKEDNIIGEQGLTGSNIGDNITHPELPVLSILNGFHNMYQPDLQVINKVNKGLWTTNFFDNFIKLYNNPIESIVSLSLSPIQPPISDNVTPIIVGNLPMSVTIGGNTESINSRYLTSQYGTYSFGAINLYENYESYLDYATNVSIYLPYIGIQSLNTSDVMGSTLLLKYNVDFFTGDFIAALQCVKPSGLNSVMYHWKGNILSHVPLSSSNFATTYLNGINTVLSVGTGNIGSLLSNMGNFKPDISRGSNTSANVGALDNFNAYLIITSPMQDRPNNYNELKGRTSNKNVTLSQGMGYVQCEEVHIQGINATEQEKTELENLLKNGIIL